jgi:hypothetical protein
VGWRPDAKFRCQSAAKAQKFRCRADPLNRSKDLILRDFLMFEGEFQVLNGVFSLPAGELRRLSG